MPEKTFAQTIVPAPDGTGTRVTPTGNQFNISGGQFSNDGANLFHSFTRFGLNQGEIANFLSNPRVQNILGRVVGGDASVIDGLLRVSGGTSNLYLMNPSGLVFGANARLDLPGNFLATTANGIRFGSSWFNGSGPNDYGALVGMPTAFSFTMARPGAILNAGNLEVGSGQTLSLLGGTISSTGQLSAPQGQVIITSVPGTTAVRIRPVGQLLSYEIDPQLASRDSPSAWTLPIVSLPELLTGRNSQSQNQSQIRAGDVAIRHLTAQTATVAATENLRLNESSLKTTGDLTLTAQNTVQVRDSTATPFTAFAQGNLFIQGNQGIDILALNHPITPFRSGGNLSLVSNGVISGDARFASGGTFSMRTLSGASGQFVSLFDPIISSNGDVTFGDYTGVALKVESRGSITGGNIRITGPDTLLSGSDPDIPILTSSRALILRAGLSTLANAENIPQSQQGTTFTSPGGPSPTGTISVGNLDTFALTSDGGPVILSAPGNISTGIINTSTNDANGGSITITSTGSGITTGNLISFSNSRQGGSVQLTAPGSIGIGNISSSGSTGSGGTVMIRSSAGSIAAGNINAFAFTGNGGAISLSTTSGSITTGNVDVSTSTGNGGDVNLSVTSGSITTGNLRTFVNTGNAGDIRLTSGSGSIATGNLVASTATGNGGYITFNARSGSIAIGDLSTFSNSGNGGSLDVTASGDVRANNIIAYGSQSGRGGDVTFRSQTGSITAADISSYGVSQGGAIVFNAASFITVGNLLSFSSTPGAGGTISLTAPRVFTGRINFGLDLARVLLPQPIKDLKNVPTDVPYSESPKSMTPNETAQYVERARREEFANHFGRQFKPVFNRPESRQFALAAIGQRLKRNIGTIYATIEGHSLQLVLETANGTVVKTVPIVEKTQQGEIKLVCEPDEFKQAKANPGKICAVNQLQEAVSDPDSGDQYREPAKIVYRKLITPLKKLIDDQKINVLMFSMGRGLRLVPLAALIHEGDSSKGDQYLIEQYSISLIPSLDLLAIDLYNYSEVNNFQVLPIGASRFNGRSDLSDLGAVPLELAIVQEKSRSQLAFLNEDLSLQNLDAQRATRPFRIIHLATHANFDGTGKDSAFIQLSPEHRLTLKQMRDRKWNNAVDLLVLSACRTAVGDENAERSENAGLSFAGVSAQIGVRSTLASLWAVNDPGSVVLMKEFYDRLLQPSAQIKSEALRQAQIAMSQGQIQVEPLRSAITQRLKQKPPVEEASFLLILNAALSSSSRSTDTATATSSFVTELRHPFYWAGFTIVGTPW